MRRTTRMLCGGFGLVALAACGGGGGSGGGGGGPAGPGVLGFTPGPTTTLAFEPPSLAPIALVSIRLADHDADGTQDLCYAFSTANVITFLLQTRPGLGNGAFGAAYPGRQLLSGEGIVWLAPGRVLGPSEQGFAFLSAGANTLGFRDVGGVPTEVGGYGGLLTFFGGMAVGDFDGDGTDDIAAADNQNGDLLRWYTQGDRSLLPAPPIPLPSSGTFGLAAADWEGDGDDDVFAAYVSGGYATFTGPQAGMLVPLGGGYGVFLDPVTGDFDGDGVADAAGIVFKSGQGANIGFLKGLGDGTFAAVVPTVPAGSPFTTPGSTFHLQAGDLDGDGLSDLALIVPGVRVLVLRGTATGVFEEFNDVDLVDPGSDTLALGDLDGDGDIDLVVGDSSSFTIRTLLNDRL